MKLHVNTWQPVSFAIPELRNKQSFKISSIPEILTNYSKSDELWNSSNSLFIKWCFRRPRRRGWLSSLTHHGYADIQYKMFLYAGKHLRVQSFSWVLGQTRRVQSLQIWRWRTFKEVCSGCCDILLQNFTALILTGLPLLNSELTQIDAIFVVLCSFGGKVRNWEEKQVEFMSE